MGNSRNIDAQLVDLWTADFNPRGASATLCGSEAEASRGLKPALLGSSGATSRRPLCTT